MAISSATVWECRSSGASDNNGGGFVAGAAGTDFSQQNSAQVVINNSTITTSITANVVTFTAGYTPTAADVGNLVQMLTGTNVTPGWYQITSQTSTTWTVTGAVNLPTSGTTTNATGNMGGALATLTKLSGAMVVGNKAFCTGAFTTTATITFAQSQNTPSGAAPPTRIIGYGSVRGDSGHASLTLSTNTGMVGLNASGHGCWFEQWDVDCANLGTSIGIAVGGNNYCAVKMCMVKNFTSAGIRVTGTFNSVQDCEVTGGTSAATAAISGSAAVLPTVFRCHVHDNACTGVAVGNDAPVFENIIVNNSGATSDGLQTAFACVVEFNTIHGNGRHGINQTTVQMNPLNIRNNLITNSGGFGIVGATSPIPAMVDFDGNAFFNNTSGNRSNMDSTTGIFGVVPYTNVNDVVLTVSPYVGPTTGSTANFALNNTAGGGAAARASANPKQWPGLTGTTSFRDMGAVQHKDSGIPSIIMATG